MTSFPKGDSLGDRMKKYEDAHRLYLPHRMPMVIRVDGKAFHSWTRKNCTGVFDPMMHEAMIATTQALCKGIMGAKVGYTQSDEISIVVTDYDSLTTESWFGKNLQKVVSVAAAMATATFNATPKGCSAREPAMFDARAFVLPREEVTNYLLWRQQDAVRNSVQMLARATMSHRECHQLSCIKLKEALLQRGIVWEDLDPWKKCGTTVLRKTQKMFRPIPRHKIVHGGPTEFVSETSFWAEQHDYDFKEMRFEIDEIINPGR